MSNATERRPLFAGVTGLRLLYDPCVFDPTDGYRSIRTVAVVLAEIFDQSETLGVCRLPLRLRRNQEITIVLVLIVQEQELLELLECSVDVVNLVSRDDDIGTQVFASIENIFVPGISVVGDPPVQHVRLGLLSDSW